MHFIIKNWLVKPQKMSGAKLKGTVATVAAMCIVCSLFFMTMSCGRQESSPVEDVENPYYFNDQGKKEIFTVRKDRVVIKTKSESDSKSLIEKNIFLEANGDGSHWVIATVDPSKTKLDDLMKISEIVDVSYALEYENGTLNFPTDQITVKCKEGRTLEMVLESNGLSKNVVEVELFDPLTELYLITLNVKLNDILRICVNLYESGMCIACPVFIRILKPHKN